MADPDPVLELQRPWSEVKSEPADYCLHNPVVVETRDVDDQPAVLVPVQGEARAK